MSKIKCPKCGSTNTIRIIYGLPSFELFKKEESGLIKLGGCEVAMDSPRLFCIDCKKDFDRISINGFLVNEFNFSVGGFTGISHIVSI